MQTSGDSEATVKRLEEQTTAKIELLSKEASDVAKDVSFAHRDTLITFSLRLMCSIFSFFYEL